MTLDEIKVYTGTVIPNIEIKLADKSISNKERVELYNLYLDVLKMIAPWDFISFNKYLEIDEDHNNPKKAFYHQRKDHLKEVFDAFNEMEIEDKYDIVLISLPPRVGKEQPLSAPILTPSGWSTMRQIKVGSKVIGYDGKSTLVTGVFPQGEKDVYKVSFDDGTSVKCGLDHLWTVQTREDRLNRKERTIPLKDIMKNLYVEGDNRKNYSIKYVEPISFENVLSKDSIHPYVLGALIGDGCLHNNFGFTNIDSEIIDKISGLLPKGETVIKVGTTISYRIKNKVLNRTSRGFLKPCDSLIQIRNMGLNVTSENKFIPKDYLYSSVENRIELLRGLMDTDGSVGSDKSTYCEYSTVSEQLSNDVIELVRSLGGRATVSTKIGSYKKNGEKIYCKKVYRIIFNLTINPFYTNRKASRFNPRKVRNNKYIVSIEKVGKEESQCIMVDSPKHLYVTEGYNLTHNTTTGIRFLAWVSGKYPEDTELVTSYSDNITSSFYIGVMEIMESKRYKEIFSDAPIVNQNAKREEIWLKVLKRYPTITFVPVGGSVTGRCEAGKYLYCDDLVSGFEEAISIGRMEKLWNLYTINFKQRKLDKAKEIHIATVWSVHDPISTLARDNENNPRCKIINIPCFDENGESNFNFNGGFSTEYYKELQRTMDSISFNALYMGEAIEREGLLYPKEDLMYYFKLPEEKEDTRIGICDSKNLGTDYVSGLVGYVYGDFVYIEDVVYNNGLPEITRPAVANLWFEHKVVRADVEVNNGGNYYAEDLDQIIQSKGGKTSIRVFFSANNKKIKIITYSDYVKKHFIFKDPSEYSPNSDYARFMKGILSWTQKGNNKFDDGVDSIAMLAQLTEDLSGNEIKIIDRKKLNF